ncbi:hypothetical protein HPE56_05155 [Maribacter sp. ANRC-HE7]|uniref:Helix-turn-helix n=1 Tax=Maribacter aquimaris TaxID=2737171 RepID=A0ABR7UY68_9FLAO|nr:hypothetical protein [Maribacter aquimaris]MBD0777176.1 hypothetical protein [Maribacter aquimaris]
MKTINDLDFGIPEEIENYTAHSAEIGIMITNYIRSIDGMNKKSFAKLVGKTASDVTRWVSGNHNFTILTLSLIEARTGMAIIKKLSDKNIEEHLKCNAFEIETEEQLKKEIFRLKNKVAELEKKIEDLSALKNTWNNVKTLGVYEARRTQFIHRIVLSGSEESTFRWKVEDVRKIRSKGNALAVEKPVLFNIE